MARQLPNLQPFVHDGCGSKLSLVRESVVPGNGESETEGGLRTGKIRNEAYEGPGGVALLEDSRYVSTHKELESTARADIAI